MKKNRMTGKITSVIILLGMLTLIIALHIHLLQQEQYRNDYAAHEPLILGGKKTPSGKGTSRDDFTEDRERNRREGTLYTIDDTEKVTLTSKNGEICVKLPRWKGFSAEWEDLSVGHEICQMANERHDYMTYELIASWASEDTDQEIADDFVSSLYNCNLDIIPGDVFHMTVNGINISYRSCYDFVSGRWTDRYCMVWANLGCGQFLKTRIVHVDRELLNVESLIEALYANIEVCTPEGDSIPISYRELLPDKEEETYHRFSFGTVREYKTDAYRETTACAGLIDRLYKAVQTGSIEEMLQREAITEKKLSIAEKMDYIKKEETGMLIRYDAGHSRVREGVYPPTQCCLVEGTDPSKEFLVYRVPDYWEDLYDYVWFPCEKDSAGAVKAQRGLYIYGSETGEHYFLSFQGNPYLCIVNRNAEEKIENVVLYDFVTPDLIGTLIYIDASSVRLCSFVRNGGHYGTEQPWYLFHNKIDAGPVFFSMLETWKVTEFLGESDAFLAVGTNSAACAREQKRTQDLVGTCLGQELNMSWNRDDHDTKSFHSASVYGYYYTSPENLYKVYRQPETLVMEAPIAAATMQVYSLDEEFDILMDRNGKTAICVEGRFFLLEKSKEEPEELRTWE